MPRNIPLLSIFLVFALATITGCKKEGSPSAGGSGAIYDSAEVAKPITVDGKNHYLYFRPKAGETFRYRVTVSTTSDETNTDQLFGTFAPKASLKMRTIYYLRQTNSGFRPDSSVNLTIKLDSISLHIEKDTTRLDFSTTREADRKDSRFSNTAMLAPGEYGVIMSRDGNISEMIGISDIVSKLLATIPDSMKTQQTLQYIENQTKSALGDYMMKTLTHFPGKPVGKDSTWGSIQRQNYTVWQNVIYPSVVDSRETLSRFEERGGKKLAVLEAVSTVKPMQNIIEQDPLKVTLNSFEYMSKATSNVEDETGVLLYRVLTQDNSYDLMIESKKQQGKIFRTIKKTTDRTTIELLK
jgi:hypothetical protein